MPDDTTNVPGPNKRVFAALVDATLFAVLTAVLIPQLGGIVFYSMYLLLRDASGRSLGKMMTGLAIVGEAGRTPTTASLILRNVPLAIPLVMIVEYLIMRRSPHGIRWGDRLAGTRVRDLNPGSDRRYFQYSLALLAGLAVLRYFTDYVPR